MDATPRPVPPSIAARSEDGRSFTVEDASESSLVAGSLVILHAEGARQLAIVEERAGTPAALRGRLLGELGDGTLDLRRSRPFASATLETVDHETIEMLHASTGAVLEVGTNLTPPGGAARLLPLRFNRHTFWCGQSGSGKTYALGVVLEQLVAHTALPIVIFDPNSDFVRLGELNPGASGPAADALAQRDIRVLRPRDDASPLRARFLDMPLPSKAAVLRLDPVANRAEYNQLVHLDQELLHATDLADVLDRLNHLEEGQSHPLAERIENLGILDWEVWAGDDTAVTDVVDERPDATVLDLGGFSTPEQQLVVALALLDDLWARREERRPVLLVIDEAHNLCAPHLDSPLAVAVRERLIQIAAEGRKFGLWLLLSTQRPSKVHSGILTQCDNLALMKMSSPVDLAELGTSFGYAPQALLARSPWFRQGEALFAGGFVPTPSLVKMNARLTPEGGTDVRVPLR
ncbi:ATP-binding protein [Agromyces aerolatus]|uniref:ATP-binding protein n=1 Tax=Agromyces sp. LY-1074 TaxID=3074080 RepID=UPI002861FFF9|nr:MULTISPECIES: ATP-binding protein [unclassified Agromyces]MDR5701196.1 ATP-binding protein [Agromyces sp. LY-1074]MDR5706928.1 ATP-binding protein [Agromyces sp. LY-1358]